jgi:radical SAM superfamily enzyme YgiQ (UPF0313 family)
MVVVGGPHPTTEPIEYLASSSIDYVVVGEGEQTFLELVRAIESKRSNLETIEGICFKQNGQIVSTKPRQRIEDITNLYNPAKNLNIFHNLYCPRDFGHIVATRGCPFSCTYCGTGPMWGEKVRMKSGPALVDEVVEVMEKFNTDQVRFWDDPFTLSRKRTTEFCERILSDGINVKWRCSTRVDLMDLQLLNLMKKAGCSQINVGIETGSQKILDTTGKGTTIDQAIDSAKIMRKVGIDWCAYVMIGFQKETHQDIDLTIRFIKRLAPDSVKFSIVSPYPGTALAKELKQAGLLPPKPDWNKVSHLSPFNHFTEKMGKEEFEEVVKGVANWVDKYNSHFFWRRLLAKRDYYIEHPLATVSKITTKLFARST